MMTQTVDQTATVLSTAIHIRIVERRNRHQNLQDVQEDVEDFVVAITRGHVARIANVSNSNASRPTAQQSSPWDASGTVSVVRDAPVEVYSQTMQTIAGEK